MASSIHQKGKYENHRQNLDLLLEVLKVMVLDDTYNAVDNPDVDFVDDGSANDMTSHELVATGYTGAFGGAGRHTLQNPTITRDDAGNFVVFDADDEPWANIGGAVNDVFAGLGLIVPKTTDADSWIVAHFNLATQPTTNGGTITVVWNASGILRF